MDERDAIREPIPEKTPDPAAAPAAGGQDAPAQESAADTAAYVHLEEAYEAGQLRPEQVPRLLRLRRDAARRFDVLEPELRLDAGPATEQEVRTAMRRVVQMQGGGADPGEVQYLADHLREVLEATRSRLQGERAAVERGRYWTFAADAEGCVERADGGYVYVIDGRRRVVPEGEDAAPYVGDRPFIPMEDMPYILGDEDPVESLADQEFLAIPSYICYPELLRALANAQDTFRTDEYHMLPTHEVQRQNLRARYTIAPQGFPGDPDYYDRLPTGMIEEATWSLKHLDDLAVDVLNITFAEWIRSHPASPDAFIKISAADILRARGLKARKNGEGRRGGFTEKQYRDISDRMQALRNITAHIQQMNVYETDKKGRRTQRTYNHRSYILLISGYVEQNIIDGRPLQSSWTVRPGDVFSRLLMTNIGRETALLSVKALQFDPYRQQLEKRLTTYFSWQWRIRQLRGDYDAPYRVQTLLDWLGEAPDKKNPLRTKERLERALNTLRQENIIAAWNYGADARPEIVGRRGWVEQWLRWGVHVTPVEAIVGHYAGIRRPAPLRLAAARPAERPQPQAHVFTAEGLKALRKRKDLSQVQLAQLLGVSQGYLSQVEKGRKPIGPAADRILKWVMEQENE